jgi:hypothetical protein
MGVARVILFVRRVRMSVRMRMPALYVDKYSTYGEDKEKRTWWWCPPIANIPNKLTARPKELTRSSWFVFISGGSRLEIVLGKGEST